MTQVSIIGAGWAGLAAAVELSRHNIPVVVYESARQVGGRARDIEMDGITLDNGQHLMIGAYTQLLALLRVCGVSESDVFHRLPQHIRLMDFQSGNIAFELKLPRWPAPLNLLGGMLTCPTLGLMDKFRTVWQFNKLLNTPLQQDIPVTAWLAQAKIPAAFSDNLLKPLCLAALTTHPDSASARIFQTVLQQTFNGPRANTDLLIAKTTLGKVFPEIAVRYIESRSGQVLTSHKISNIDPASQTMLANDRIIHYQNLIIATSAHITQTLLQPIPQLDDTSHKLSQLQHNPVCTIYLQYPPDIRLPIPMLGCLHATSEWIFDRSYCNQPGLMAVIISAHGDHMLWSNEELINKISSELAQLFPEWPAPVSAQVIREKRAGFSCVTHSDNLRPHISTAISHIKLCGDYVYSEDNLPGNILTPGLPATLEAAVRSGVKCAQQTLQDMRSCNT